MRIDKYLECYARYRNVYHTMKQMAECIKNNEPEIVECASFWREFEKHGRILRRATARLEAAISRIGDETLSNYLICRYFYGFKNARIAMMYSYCERQIYRIASRAKKGLYRELLKLMPKPRRGEKNKKYRFKKKY